jgi:Domain of unknown function (DUF4157)/Novel AID APOBEC clade 1
VEAPKPAARKRPTAGPSPLAAAPPQVKLSVVRASNAGGGAPLAPAVKSELERSFKADLSAVRVHSDGNAREVAVTLAARAVTHGSHVFLGPGENANDVQLMAHEVAHVVQQKGGPATQAWSESGGDRFEHEAQRAAAAVARGDTFAVRERTDRPRIQRFGISNILDKLAGMANNIPGFRMFTIVLGVNPVNMASVPRTAANILRAAVELIPGGGVITQAADAYGVFDKIGTWVEQQISSLGMVGSAIRAGLMKFLDSIELTDLVPWNLGKLADKAIATLTAPVKQVVNFVINLAADILKFLKDALLMPLAKLAEGTRGYDLLKAIIGTDPITGDPVPRTAETLIPGFLKLIGEEETWQNMQKSGAIPKAWAWFQGAMGAALGFVQEIPGLVVSTIKSITLGDVFPITGVFVKVGKTFGDFIGRFISWIGTALWNLLEIIFEVVSPGALGYIKKTAAALKSILKNPAPFVGNLIKAAKGGFDAFAGNFLNHLKAGLIDWLTGSLPGVYIPKSFALGELVKFVLSVLGLSWANVRQKLVKAIGEVAVKALEAGFDLVVTLVTKGPAAFWEQLKDNLSDLKDMVVQGIIDMVVGMIVQKAIPKLVAMFIPGAGFISLILTIYDTVMVFVNKIKQIIAVVTAFIDSIVAIAAGNIGAAVSKVESILARLLSLAISFLAGFAGLGKVADKVMGVINKVRAPIDKALDKLIAWVVGMAKKLFAKAFGKKDAKDPAGVKGKAKAELAQRLKGTVSSAAQVAGALGAVMAKLKPEGLKSLRIIQKPKSAEFSVDAEASPGEKVGDFTANPELDASDLNLAEPQTVLVATLNGKSLGRKESEKGGRHAEEVLLAELKATWSTVAKGDGTDKLEINITRSPCGPGGRPKFHNCAGQLDKFVTDKKVSLTLRMMSLYQAKGAKAESGLRKLALNPKVQLEIWDVSWKELAKYGIDPNELPVESKQKISKRLGDLFILLADIGKVKK